MKIVAWKPGTESRALDAFLNRPAFDDKAEAVAARVLAAIRREGDRAVSRYTLRFGGARLAPSRFRVTDDEIRAATAGVPADIRAAVAGARKRIAAFAKAGLRRDWSMRAPRGGRLGERFVALDRIGVYVPGGAAPLASTAMMTATLAAVAGVREIVGCTPCRPDGSIDPVLLHAMRAAGCTEIYRIGGIPAIGMMAYGTKSIARVQKIVGPGGPFVTAAKRQVYGQVALDLVAGPSEVAVLADETADASYVAADLLSQAEHGTGHEKILLVATSRAVAARVRSEALRQTKTLERAGMIRKVMDRGALAVVVKSVRDGIELCNRFAPEHLELHIRDARRLLKHVRCAGAVFVGPWSPESAGDFAAGPSHVLPTGGAAAMFSGLTSEQFQRRMSVIDLTRADLAEMLPVIEAFSRVEGLAAHGRSARIRFGA